MKILLALVGWMVFCGALGALAAVFSRRSA